VPKAFQSGNKVLGRIYSFQTSSPSRYGAAEPALLLPRLLPLPLPPPLPPPPPLLLLALAPPVVSGGGGAEPGGHWI
jgi:hypothetical protein